MLCGYLPFSADSQAEMFDLIKSGRFAFHVESWSDVSPEAKDFISKLLIVDPSARMKAKDAVEHPWLTKFAAEEAAKVADLSGTIKRNASRRGGIGTLRKVALQSKGGLVDWITSQGVELTRFVGDGLTVLRALGSQNTSTSGLVESRVANAPAIPEPDSEASFEKGKEEIPDLTEKVAGSVAAVTLEAKEGEVVKA